MIMRLIDCEAGHVHVIGPCSNCYDAQGGLLLGTVSKSYEGRVHTICMDCGETVDYYINAKEQMLFKLESIEARGPASSKPQAKAKDVEKTDTEAKAKDVEKTDTEAKAKEDDKTDTEAKAKDVEKTDTEAKAKEDDKTDTDSKKKVSIFA